MKTNTNETKGFISVFTKMFKWYALFTQKLKYDMINIVTGETSYLYKSITGFVWKVTFIKQH